MRNIVSIIALTILISSCNKISLYKLSGDICTACSQNPRRIIGMDTVLTPTVITPNGDGRNDFFLVYYLNKYPDNTLIIYDRSKNQIAKFSPYNNDWNGHYNNKIYGNGLYFYQLTIDSNTIEGSFLSLATKDDYFNIKVSENTCGKNCVLLDSSDPLLQ